MNPFLQNPEPLPSPPLWEVLLLDYSLLTAAVLAAVGVAAGLWLLRGGRARAGVVAALAVLALACGVALAGWVIPSPRRHLIELSHRLVAAVVDASRNGRPAGLGALLDERVTLTLGRASTPMTPGQLAALAHGRLRGARAVSSWSITKTRGVMDGAYQGRVQLRVRALGDSGEVVSWWIFSWRSDASGKDGAWRAVEIEAQAIGGVGALETLGGF